MVRRRRQLAAVSLGIFVLAEIMFSVMALGHRHVPTDAPGVTACSHGHAHPHVHFCESSAASHAADACQSDDAATHDQPTEVPVDHSDCSICRYLAQAATATVFTVEIVSHELTCRVDNTESFDVASPTYLLPRPRSPPAAA